MVSVVVLLSEIQMPWMRGEEFSGPRVVWRESEDSWVGEIRTTRGLSSGIEGLGITRFEDPTADEQVTEKRLLR